MMNLRLEILNWLKRRSSEVHGKRKKWIFLMGLILVCFSLIYLLKPFPKPSTPPIDPNASIVSTPKEPPLQIIEGHVKERSTLFKSLTEENIPLQWIELIISKLKPYVNFKKIKGGTYHFISNVKGELVKFIYKAGPTEVYEIEKDSKGYTAQKKVVPLKTHLVKIEGEICSSLYEAMDAIGEQDQLVISFAEILACEIDFYKDVKGGDQFKVIVEKVYQEDQFVHYGLIHAVEYQRGEKTIRGIQYKGSFYNEKGVSLRKAFLKAPLRFNRISSRFSRARSHPILGGVLPHFGVDYAAPPGTPIWAVADGQVVSCGWNEGFGKQVILHHPNGYTTYYGHLSSYGPGLRRGVRVKQKQIIGYVGSTGLSTGPHLDYRLAKGGRFKNPLKETFPMGVPIDRGEMEAFQKRRDEVIGWLQGNISYLLEEYGTSLLEEYGTR